MISTKNKKAFSFFVRQTLLFVIKHGQIHLILDFLGVIEPSEHDGHNFKPLKNTLIMRRRHRPSKIESSFCVGVCRINLTSMDITERGFLCSFRIWKRKKFSPTHFGENQFSKFCVGGVEKCVGGNILRKFATKFWFRKYIYYIGMTHAWVINRSF